MNPGAGNSIQVSHVSGRDPSTRNSCPLPSAPPSCIISRKLGRAAETGLEPRVCDVGILGSVLTPVPTQVQSFVYTVFRAAEVEDFWNSWTHAISKEYRCVCVYLYKIRIIYKHM